MKENEIDKIRYHSLYVYNELCRDEQRRDILRFVAMVMLAAAVVALVIFLSGCGGGSPAAPPAALPVVAPMKKPAPPPPPPPPPVTLPKTYSMTMLAPLPGYTDAQAEAISQFKVIAGYSVGNEIAEATEWLENGSSTDLGPGYALAINGSQVIVGYSQNPAGLPVATVWNGASAYQNMMTLPLLDGYDSSTATGIDEDGTIVGTCFVYANPVQQTAVKWDKHGRISTIPSLETALAIHKGTIAGVDWSGSAATNQTTYGIGGAATALSDAGVVGFTTGTVQAFDFTTSLNLLGTNGTAISLASGIARQGVVIGQVGVGAAGSERLSRRGWWRSHDTFQGITRAMAWTATDGMIDLNTRILPALSWTAVFATGINDSGSVVGAAVNNETGQTVGFLLEAQ